MSQTTRQQSPIRVLRVNGGANHTNSITRPLADQLIERLGAAAPTEITVLEVSDGVPFVDGNWIAGVYEGATTEAALDAKATSDAYARQLLETDVLVISAPIYNFSVPAALKAWIDQIARAGLTFRYTGPGQIEGLVRDVSAYVVVGGGGVSLGDERDFLSPYLRQVLGFVGITDVHFVDATGTAFDADGAVARATQQVHELVLTG
jgi:FMN-dependent NADH-azoreductase